MTKILVIVLTALSLSVPTLARADDAAEVKAVDTAYTALNTAYETKDLAAIKALTTADHHAIAGIYDGSATTDQQIALFGDVEYSVYDPTAPKISLIAPDVAVVHYAISMVGTFRGDPLPRRVFVTQIWVKQGGEWLQRLHQETTIGDR